MSIKYTFSISNDTLNSIVDSGSLTEEIQTSTITTALDYINKELDDCDIWFKAALSGTDQTTLSGVVSTHTGEPLADAGNIRIVDQSLDSVTEVDDQGRLKVAIDYETHDHDDLYYTQEEVTTISGELQYGIDNHLHEEGDITDLDKYTQAEVDALIASASGTTDHSDLDNLDYASSGHTGFAQEDHTHASVSGVVGGPLPCLQVRRTTDYAFTSSWVDITFDTTDVENNADVIEHNDAVKDRMQIKEDGYYGITYSMPIECLDNAEYRARIVINDTTEVSGSLMWIKDSNDIQFLGNDFATNLSANDYISLQLGFINGTPGQANMKADLVMKIVKLQGVKGDSGADGAAGAPGTGSTINILEDNVLTASGIGYLNFEGDVSVVDDGGGTATVTVSGGGGSGIVGDMTTVQTRRSTIYTLTTSYVDIEFDVTDEENDSTVIEHNDTNTERIDIKADGMYVLFYDFVIDASTAAWDSTQAEGQIEKNGTTVVSGSWSSITTFNDDSIDGSPLQNGILSNAVVATLSNGDYVTFQAKYSIDVADTAANGTFKVIKLSGTKGADGADGTDGVDGSDGAAGPSGSGSTINVYDDGVLVSGSPFEALNFSEATISGSSTVSGGVDIEVSSGGSGSSIFGSEYDYAESEGESSTTATTWQQKVRLSVSNIPTGTYRIGWSYEWSFSTQESSNAAFTVNIDEGVNTIHQSEMGVAKNVEYNDGSFFGSGGFGHEPLSVGNHTIDLNFKASAAGTTYIRKARLEIWRVS